MSAQEHARGPVPTADAGEILKPVPTIPLDHPYRQQLLRAPEFFLRRMVPQCARRPLRKRRWKPDRRDIFPFCNLHERPVIDELPRGCAFRWDNPLQAIAARRDRAHARDGHAGRVEDFHIADVCGECVQRLSAHVKIKILRCEDAPQGA